MINQLALFYLQKTAEKRGSKLRFKRLFLAWSIHYTSENKHKNSAIIRQPYIYIIVNKLLTQGKGNYIIMVRR